MTTSQLAAEVGKGLLAGLIGTAVMTISSTIEMKLRQREASEAPVEAVSKVTGIEPDSERSRKQMSTVVHWAYGTLWGGVRGLIGALGLHGIVAAAVHFAAVWGAALIMLPSLRIAPPVTRQEPKETAIDGFHHVTYAAATSTAFEMMDGR
jgi:hypothetical protein